MVSFHCFNISLYIFSSTLNVEVIFVTILKSDVDLDIKCKGNKFVVKIFEITFIVLKDYKRVNVVHFYLI